ncbi:hypothetical protein WN55_03029 [Dufourea novaeangliae]|uniref:Uncharacterized protein n=1 Tax=Dufourea novaeangliae TaxID=178035 RepID=A0A154PJQ1_DUFNO|nr:hypothetical protein WN55_03029 [Dufourea novaeangliae]
MHARSLKSTPFEVFKWKFGCTLHECIRHFGRAPRCACSCSQLHVSSITSTCLYGLQNLPIFTERPSKRSGNSTIPVSARQAKLSVRAFLLPDLRVERNFVICSSHMLRDTEPFPVVKM